MLEFCRKIRKTRFEEYYQNLKNIKKLKLLKFSYLKNILRTLLWIWNSTHKEWKYSSPQRSQITSKFLPIQKTISLGVSMGWWISLWSSRKNGWKTCLKSNKKLARYYAAQRMDSQITKQRSLERVFVQLSSFHVKRYERWQSTNSHLSAGLSSKKWSIKCSGFIAKILVDDKAMVSVVPFDPKRQWYISIQMARQHKPNGSFIHFRHGWLSQTNLHKRKHRSSILDVFLHKIHDINQPPLRIKQHIVYKQLITHQKQFHSLHRPQQTFIHGYCQ